MTEKQKIQRIFCKTCDRTTHLLPSFLLYHKSFMVSALEALIRLRLNQPTDWIKSPELKMELSKAYAWLRQLKKQIDVCLPLLREKLLTLQPDAPVRTQSVPGGLIRDVELIQQFMDVAQSLHQTTISLINKSPEACDLFSFLNYFLAQNTGKALLEI